MDWKTITPGAEYEAKGKRGTYRMVGKLGPDGDTYVDVFLNGVAITRAQIGFGDARQYVDDTEYELTAGYGGPE